VLLRAFEERKNVVTMLDDGTVQENEGYEAAWGRWRSGNLNALSAGAWFSSEQLIAEVLTSPLQVCKESGDQRFGRRKTEFDVSDRRMDVELGIEGSAGYEIGGGRKELSGTGGRMQDRGCVMNDGNARGGRGGQRGKN